NESHSGPNPEMPAKSHPMPKSAGPAASSNQAFGGNAPLPGKADWSDSTSDEGTLYIIKAADYRSRPKGTYFGKMECENALKSDSEEHWLLYVIVPNGSRGLRLRYAVGGREVPMEDPRMIYRMPDSPLYTFVVVDSKYQGRLDALRDGKTIGNLDFASLSDALAAMPLRWHPKTGTVSFLRISAEPAGRFGFIRPGISD